MARDEQGLIDGLVGHVDREVLRVVGLYPGAGSLRRAALPKSLLNDAGTRLSFVRLARAACPLLGAPCSIAKHRPIGGHLASHGRRGSPRLLSNQPTRVPRGEVVRDLYPREHFGVAHGNV